MWLWWMWIEEERYKLSKLQSCFSYYCVLLWLKLFFFLTFFNAVSFSFFPIEPIFYSLWQSKTTNMEIGKIKPRKSFSITLSHFNNSIPVLIWICPLKLFFESSFNSSLNFDVHLSFFFLTTSMLCSSLLSFWTNINL